MLFCYLQLLHSEITYFTLKQGDGIWKKWRPLLFSIQLTLYSYVPAWAVGASRIAQMSAEGATYMSVSGFFFSLKPLFFLPPFCKRWSAGLTADNSDLSSACLNWLKSLWA